jgi:hypothetical protein
MIYNLDVVRGLVSLFDPEERADVGTSGSERPD